MPHSDAPGTVAQHQGELAKAKDYHERALIIKRAHGPAGIEVAASLDDLGLHEDHVVLGAARRFHYSNLGFGLLGELVAQARGTSWEEAVTAEVRTVQYSSTTPPTEQSSLTGAAHLGIADPR